MMPRYVPRLHRMQNAHCFLSFVKVNCFAVDQIGQRAVALSTTGSDARAFEAEDTSSLSSLPSSRGRRNDAQAQMRNMVRAITPEEIDQVATVYARKALPTE
jgi:hypothetical protein